MGSSCRSRSVGPAQRPGSWGLVATGNQPGVSTETGTAPARPTTAPAASPRRAPRAAGTSAAPRGRGGGRPRDGRFGPRSGPPRGCRRRGAGRRRAPASLPPPAPGTGSRGLALNGRTLSPGRSLLHSHSLRVSFLVQCCNRGSNLSGPPMIRLQLRAKCIMGESEHLAIASKLSNACLRLCKPVIGPPAEYP